ncbi:PID-CTERM protein-sorting domain-containing protein [uncultured Flavobacterium sp.]|uniref:PID-CTERM protein-sorting domain-containing protein n=2 Tax=Flavobacterium TaxID=237 RepID=UPI000E8404F4|nr:hypothetical protein [uncultured Flavobacterium sp.]HBI00911.1 hypothetical protein [Flavobacterium sp.]
MSKYFVKEKIYLHLHPMRIVPNKFLIALMGCFIGMVSVSSYASAVSNIQNPPPPTPPPPGLPIDGGVVLLLLIGLVFAFYKYSQNQNIKKTLK